MTEKLTRASNRISRRSFVAATATGAAALVAAPTVITASRTVRKEIITGEGDYRYRVHHAWPQLPSKYSWQTTHNVAIDPDGMLYVIHEGRSNQKDHPSIFVFDPKGKFVRAFGNQFQGGGHGIEVRVEDGQSYLYVCAYQEHKTFCKMDLKGEMVWQKFAPMDAGVYAKDEDTKPKKVWGRNRFMPTNFAFFDNGDFLLADGYGSYYIHHYDSQGNWKSCFGGPGKGNGKFNLPHGIWIDKRDKKNVTVAVCDRANNTVQRLSLEGKHLETLPGYGLPANIDTWNDLMVVPELVARVTLLDGDNKVVARLGGDVKRVSGNRGIRNDAKLWQAGRFIHPHDACFDTHGNIFVAEWVGTGRITKLERLA